MNELINYNNGLIKVVSDRPYLDVRTLNYPPIKNTNDININIPAKSISIDKMVINKIGINDYISSNVFVAGSTGWRIHGDGDAEFNNVVVRGEIQATTGKIGDWAISADGIYYDGTGTPYIKTALTVGAGSTGVIFDKDGIRGYDSILGKVFDLPTDGSAPEFSSGIISESIFEINTNAILRTSSTVGDGTSDSDGVLINDTGFYACGINQLPSTANVRILATGNAYFKGEITADSGSIGSFTIGTYLYSGSKTAYNDTNAGVHIGSDGIGIGNNIFTVSSAGALVATSATITGAITATSGSFTGAVTVGNTGYLAGGGLTGFDNTITYNDASTDYNDATVNYGGSRVKGFFLGYDTDDYKVLVGDPGANRIAWNGSSLTVVPGDGSIINGSYISNATITTAKIQDAAITDAKIDTLSANKLTAGTIDASVINVTNLDADNIITGTLDASIVNVRNLNASTINTGVLNADLMTTGKVQSSDTKTYFDLDNDRLIVNDGTYDRVIIGKLS